MKKLFMVLALAVCAYGQTGLGKSTLTCLDVDGDGYGAGPGCRGPDADDNDSTVWTAPQAIAKYGTLQAFLTHRGYSNTRIWIVSPTGNDGACSVNGSACATWGHVATVMSPGDLVLGRSGTWTGVTVAPPSGTSGSPTVFMAYPGELPFIDNRSTTMANAIDLLSHNWITIDGIKAAGGLGNSGCIGGGNGGNITIRYTETTECTDGGIDAFNNLSNWLVEYNVMHDFNTAFCNACQHALYMGARGLAASNITIRRNLMYNPSANYPALQWNGRVTNLQIYQNIIYNGGGNAGISLLEGVSNSKIYDNLIFNNGGGITIANYDGDCYTGTSAGICPYDQTGNVVSNNSIYIGNDPADGSPSSANALYVANNSTGCPAPWTPQTLFGTGQQVLDPNSHIQKTAAVGVSGSGPSWNDASGGTPDGTITWTDQGVCTPAKQGNLGGNTFTNNIFVAEGIPVLFKSCTLATFYSSCALDASDTSLASSVFQNNIFWPYLGVDKSNIVFTAPGASYTGHNLVALKAGLWSASSSGNISADPQLVAASPSFWNSPSSFNLALQPGSPALGAGTTLGAPPSDVWGTPEATPPAIGAYQPTAQAGSSGAVISALSCAPVSLLSSASATCAVTLSQPAGAGGALVAISSNSLLLAAPTNVSVAASASTATFTVTAGTIPSGLTAVVTASLNGSSQTASLALTIATLTQVRSVACTPGSLASAATSTCTVTLTQAAGASGATVALVSSVPALAVPAGILVAAGASSASFSATTGTIATAQSAIISATLNGASSAASISLTISTGAAMGSWQQSPGTTLTSVCPANNFGGIAYPFANYCPNVIDAWSGAAADTKRNRMIIWGGGHSDYQGNEIYALNVGTTPATMTRLTNPSAWNYSVSYEVNPDGTPTSRHTYNDLVYLPAQDALFSFSGGPPNGIGTNRTWMFTFADNKWHAQDPVNGFNPMTVGVSVTGAACAYDPNTQTVFCINGNTNYLLQYNPATNTYTKLSIGAAYALTATPAIDPIRKLMVFMGNAADGATFKVNAIDISGNDPNYTVQDWTAQVTGCAGMSVDWPGFVYDSAISQFVGYPNQGSTVYTFDAGTKTCAAQSFSNGPQTNPVLYGTFGRFQYFPSLNTFTLVNDPKQNAYSVSLTSAPTVPPPSSACDLNSDGMVNALDVQIAINQALGINACSTADLTGNGQCTVVDVQRVINASLGGACTVGQ